MNISGEGHMKSKLFLTMTECFLIGMNKLRMSS